MSDLYSQHRIFVDHYAILGVGLLADEPAVKAAFRRLAKVHHPDYSGDDGLKFLEVYNAYRVLGDTAAREQYDRQYRAAISSWKNENEQAWQDIPASRLKYPGDIASLARRRLLRKKFRSYARRKALKIDYDVELILLPRELQRRLRVNIPVVTRNTCQVCWGADPDCYACHGKGSYKTSRMIRLDLEGGLMDGQIIEINLRSLKPGSMSHFKRRRMRLKISAIKLKRTAS